jgi:hypothetical protein
VRDPPNSPAVVAPRRGDAAPDREREYRRRRLRVIVVFVAGSALATALAAFVLPWAALLVALVAVPQAGRVTWIAVRRTAPGAAGGPGPEVTDSGFARV